MSELEVVLKAQPQEGDVIVLRAPKDYPMSSLWDALDELQEKGVRIVVVTDDIEVTEIRAGGSYLITTENKLPDGLTDRIYDQWKERFPEPRVMVRDRATVEQQMQGQKPAIGLDTL